MRKLLPLFGVFFGLLKHPHFVTISRLVRNLIGRHLVKCDKLTNQAHRLTRQLLLYPID